MDLAAVKERIKREHRKGDIKEACRRAGIEESVYRYAMQRKRIEDLRPFEIKAIFAVISLLDERIEMINKITGAC